MNQVTCYLYEYKHSQKTRNVGFVKIQRQGNRLRMYIHGKGMDLKSEEHIQVYLFYVKEEHCMLVQLGHIKGKNENVNCMIDIEKVQLPEGHSFESMDGAIFEQENGNKYVAAWKSVVVNVDNMLVEEEETAAEAVVEVQQVKPQETEAPVAAQQQDVKDIKDVKMSGIQCKKIQRQDISQLPRKEWKLANNSFLLHGYYSYQHLLFIEEEKEEKELLWLGVPGIFHEKEQAAAKSFGFGDFRRINTKELGLNDKERNSSEDFGYWCRQIQRLQGSNGGV